jgi:hypothetical protein
MRQLALAIVIALSACDESLQGVILPTQVNLEAKGPGAELSSRMVAAGDPIYDRLRELLIAEQNGWHKSFVSYARGPYVFSTPEFSINCFPNGAVIVLYGKAIQLEKGIPDLLSRLSLPNR